MTDRLRGNSLKPITVADQLAVGERRSDPWKQLAEGLRVTHRIREPRNTQTLPQFFGTLARMVWSEVRNLATSKTAFK